MGYEIAAGLGVKMAAPDREVYVLVGDGSYLMMAQEIATSIQEGVRLIVLILDNHGFASIGGLSRVGRLCWFRDRVPLSRSAQTGSSTAICCRSTSPPTPQSLGRPCDTRVHARRSPRRDRDRPQRRPHHRDRDPGRSRAACRRLRIVVGRADRGSVDDRGGADRASRVCARPNPGAQLPVTRHAGSLRVRGSGL